MQKREKNMKLKLQEKWKPKIYMEHIWFSTLTNRKRIYLTENARTVLRQAKLSKTGMSFSLDASE